MDIQALTGQASLRSVTGTPTTMTSPTPTPTLSGTLSGIASQLGMSVGSVQGALRQGASITSLAAQQGVSRDALVQSAQNQIQRSLQSAGRQPLDATQLDRMVNRAFDRVQRSGAGG
jgi:hypothetical protein